MSGDLCPGGDRFLAFLKTQVENIKIGHPLEADVKLGPVVCRSQYEKVMRYIAEGKAQGAVVLTGGQRAPEFDKGFVPLNQLPSPCRGSVL